MKIMMPQIFKVILYISDLWFTFVNKKKNKQKKTFEKTSEWDRSRNFIWRLKFYQEAIEFYISTKPV